VNAHTALSCPSIEISFDDVLARARPKRWPLIMCGLVSAFATIFALTSSPLGQHPIVKPALDVACTKVDGVVTRVVHETRVLVVRLR
jgi:hypothetical protein